MESVVFRNYLAVLAAASAFSKASSPAAIAALCDLIFAIIMQKLWWLSASPGLLPWEIFKEPISGC